MKKLVDHISRGC